MQNHIGRKGIGQYLVGEGGRRDTGIAGLPLADVLPHETEIIGRESAMIVFFQRTGLTEVIAGEIERKPAHGIVTERTGSAGTNHGFA